jgi:NAD+ synthase
VTLPCSSDPRDEADARLVVTHFDVSSLVIDLEPAYEALVPPLQSALASLPPAIAGSAAGGDARLPLANVRPRLRMTALYFLANSLNYLVAGAANRSELTVGYFTKHGDGGVDILPIGHLLKSDVKEIARELGVPQPIIDKAPSAGLWAGQTDEAEMGFRYADLERYLTGGPEGVSPAFALRLERLIRSTEHKRALPPDPSGATF